MRQHVVFVLGAVLLVAGIPLLLQEEKLLVGLGIILLFCGIANFVAGYGVRSMRT